jgi:hypothetical protein
MAKGCRDCDICTEASIKALIFGIPRIIIILLTCWNIGLFQKKCPQCGHKLSIHKRTSSGRFAD